MKAKQGVVVIVGVIVAIVLSYGLIWALLGLWNSTIPQIFPGVNPLTFELSFRLLLLLVIFGGFFGGGHHVSQKVTSKPDNRSKGIRIGFGTTDEDRE